MVGITVRVDGIKRLNRKIADLVDGVDKELLDPVAMKIANATAGAIRRHMTMSGIKRKSETLWNSFQPRKIKKGNWIISPIGKQPSGLPTSFLASMLENGYLTSGFGFWANGRGRHGEGIMVKLEEATLAGHNIRPHQIRGRHFIESGVSEGRTRAIGIAEHDTEQLIRRVFR